MKIYIAGPMSGIEEFNYPAFHAAAKHLRAAGHEVINPAEVCPELGMPWDFYMRKDIAAMLECEAVYLLHGWSASKGACLEHHIARTLDMHVQVEGVE